MSKDIKNIENNVMEQIQMGKLKMRPKVYYIVGTILTFVGLVASIVISVFSAGLIRFLFRSNGILEHKIDCIISIFPWWIFILAILSFVIGILLIRKYDFSYKIDFKVIIIMFILAIIVGGWIVDSIGLNDILIHRGPMQGMMRQYIQDL